jgi:hypothetical protein
MRNDGKFEDAILSLAEIDRDLAIQILETHIRLSEMVLELARLEVGFREATSGLKKTLSANLNTLSSEGWERKRQARMREEMMRLGYE